MKNNTLEGRQKAIVEILYPKYRSKAYISVRKLEKDLKLPNSKISQVKNGKQNLSLEQIIARETYILDISKYLNSKIEPVF